MRLAFAIFAAVVVAAPVRADDGEVHPLPLRIGDHGVIEAHIATASENGKTSFLWSEQTEADIDYAYSAEGDGYRVTATLVRYEWLWNGQPRGTTGSEADKMLVRAMYPVTYVADSRLVPVRIENWNEVKARIDVAAEDIVRLFTEKEGAEMGQTQRAALKARFGGLTPQTALSWYASAKLTRTGNFYPPMVENQPVLTREDSDWPREGKMVKVKIEESSTLLQWDPASGVAHVVSDRTTAPVDVTAAMLAEWAKRPKRYIDYGKDWVVHDRCDVDIALATGLVSKSTCSSDDGFLPDPDDAISNSTVITLMLKP